MKKIFIASSNLGKINEFTDMLNEYGLEIITPEDLKIKVDVEETGSTFLENALIKGKWAAEKTGLISIADDSGLEVDALGGRPGVYSSRYGGTGNNYDEKMKILLDELKNIPDDKRTARFKSAIVVVFPSGETIVEEGICEGKIAKEPKGNKGFGYDPIFYLNEYGKTFGELDGNIKNKISHRAKALIKIQLKLEKRFLKGDQNEDSSNR
jgi:XTP/dITP diphosphohydrolase